MKTVLKFLGSRFSFEKPANDASRVSGITSDQAVPELTLYYSPACLYCLRVLTAIRILGLNLASKNVLTEPGAREELIRSGGSSMVPCLKIEKGKDIQWLYESNDIISYLESIKNRKNINNNTGNAG